MAENRLHERAEALSAETIEMHRALASLIEELEAVDWYGQRVDACGDPDLARVLAHNRDEEKEHACMTLEWIRRHDERFDQYLRKFLFQSGSIVGSEHGAGDDDATLGLGSLRDGSETATGEEAAS